MTTPYAIRHITRFLYTSPVSESVMELRMRPATDGTQRCLQFEVEVAPRARVFAYRDFLGNWVHHFDIPRRHSQLTITARAQVQVDAPAALPARLGDDAWAAVDGWAAGGDHWDFRQPSHFATWSPALLDFVAGLGPGATRVADPLTTVRRVMAAIHDGFEYAPKSTRVDSPIDDALAARRGVCQDFTHVMIATLRRLGLPCRYVSGYMAPRPADDDATAASTIATHAWVETFLPDLGWVGLDPTHNVEAGVRHVRVAIGRDYADVPPTRGTFKGTTASTLEVSVDVTPAEALPTLDPAVIETAWTAEAPPPADDERDRQMQQQQQ
ncbi:MAG: transglutaminase N-terminal domain-containing protein [Vicinamibacterales bacterium]